MGINTAYYRLTLLNGIQRLMRSQKKRGNLFIWGAAAYKAANIFATLESHFVYMLCGWKTKGGRLGYGGGDGNWTSASRVCAINIRFWSSFLIRKIQVESEDRKISQTANYAVFVASGRSRLQAFPAPDAESPRNKY